MYDDFEVVLNNGAVVLDWVIRKGRLGEKAFVGLVLAERRNESVHDPYVTWEIASDNIDMFDAFSGNYFPDYGDALNDFLARVKHI